MKIYELLFKIIQTGIFGKECYTSEVFCQLNDEAAVKQLFCEAKKHDISALIAFSIERSGYALSDNPYLKSKCEKEQFAAVYRYENMAHELERVCTVFDEEKAECILLKGAVIRELYEKPWLRTSCDIDVLVRSDKCRELADVLVNKLGYEIKSETDHDIGMFSPAGVHLELHHSLGGGKFLKNFSCDESLAWERKTHIGDKEYIYRMDDAMFLYYHVLHTAKHVMNGGCGIKPLLDTYILKKEGKLDGDRRELVEKYGLSDMLNGMIKLSEAWFDGVLPDDMTKKLGEYVLGGGVYGNMSNLVVTQSGLEGSRLKYVMSRLFMPYDTMILRYPQLEGKKWQMPYYTVRRWGETLFGERFKHSIKEMKISTDMSNTEKSEAEEMMRSLGLK